jgi:hypothetical protein
MLTRSAGRAPRDAVSTPMPPRSPFCRRCRRPIADHPPIAADVDLSHVDPSPTAISNHDQTAHARDREATACRASKILSRRAEEEIQAADEERRRSRIDAETAERHMRNDRHPPTATPPAQRAAAVHVVAKRRCAAARCAVRKRRAHQAERPVWHATPPFSRRTPVEGNAAAEAILRYSPRTA